MATQDDLTAERAACSEKVHETGRGVGFYPCQRMGKIQRDGKWYCTQHDPVRRKEKQLERYAKYQERQKQRHLYSQAQLDAALKTARQDALREAASLIKLMPMLTAHNVAAVLDRLASEGG